MEVYYRKYAMTFKYRCMRWIGDIKFKRKKKKQRRSQPLPKYTPPNRTPEQQLEIDNEMKRLYKEYHVSFAEKIRRHFEKRKTDKQQQAQQGG
jgi:transposase